MPRPNWRMSLQGLCEVPSPKKESSVLGRSQFQMRGCMKGFLKWFGDAFAHAMGAIDAEEKSHVPPPIGMTPYRDQPMKRGHGY